MHPNWVLDELQNFANFAIFEFFNIKAFDTNNHQKLVIKLQNPGIRGTSLLLSEKYFTQRSQYTSSCEILSNPLELKYGISQGFILCSFTFLLYINDKTKCYTGVDCKDRRVHGDRFKYACSDLSSLMSFYRVNWSCPCFPCSCKKHHDIRSTFDDYLFPAYCTFLLQLIQVVIGWNKLHCSMNTCQGLLKLSYHWWIDLAWLIILYNKLRSDILLTAVTL